MRHPVFGNLRYALMYSGVWILAELAHMFILWHGMDFPLYLALLDTAVSNTLFALLGLALWYPVYYNRTAKISTSSKLINTITAGIVSVLLWYSLCALLLDSAYMQYAGYSFQSVHHWRIESSLFYFVIILLSYHIFIFQQNIKDKQTREEELQAQLRNAELNALKSQISPHFLFNSLNSISSLTMFEPSKAQEMIIKLSDYLRYSVTAAKSMTATYEQEMENICRYLDIEKIRFGERIRFSFNNCQECSNCLMPSLLMQPIFENAIKHGVNESTDPIKIKVSARLEDAVLHLEISNNYPSEQNRKSGTGTGLKNVASRLAVMYGSSQLMQVQKSMGLFTVSIKIPQPQLAQINNSAHGNQNFNS